METASNLAEFEALLNKSFEEGTPKENTVVNGTIIATGTAKEIKMNKEVRKAYLGID